MPHLSSAFQTSQANKVLRLAANYYMISLMIGCFLDNRVGDRSRIGGLRRRGSMRGSRGSRRGGGSWRGTANTPSSSKPEGDDNNDG